MFAMFINWRNAFTPCKMAQWVKAHVSQARQPEVQLWKPHKQKNQLYEIVIWLLICVPLSLLNKAKNTFKKVAHEPSQQSSQWTMTSIHAYIYCIRPITHIIYDPWSILWKEVLAIKGNGCLCLRESMLLITAFLSLWQDAQVKQYRMGKDWP